MLEKIVETIKSVPDIPFSEFYMNYMMAVQDANIDMEVSSAFRNVSLDVKILLEASSAIQNSYEGLVKI